ncbi:hypothetical protein GCM10027422_34850 [Hymenobacter arcticus]
MAIVLEAVVAKLVVNQARGSFEAKGANGFAVRRERRHAGGTPKLPGQPQVGVDFVPIARVCDRKQRIGGVERSKQAF